MGILSVGDLGLPAETEPLHSDAVSRVDMGADHEGSMLGKTLIRAKDIGGRAHLTAAEAVFRHSQEEEKVLHQAHSRPLWEDRQNVKPELGSELEPGEYQNLAEQAPEFGKPLRFGWFLPAEILQKLEILDLAPEVSVAADRVVIRHGDGIETAFFSPVQDVEDADPGLLVVDGGRSVNMKVDAAPGEILCRGCLCNAGTGSFWSPTRPLTSRCSDG